MSRILAIAPVILAIFTYIYAQEEVRNYRESADDYYPAANSRGSVSDADVYSGVQNPPHRDEEVRWGSSSDTPVQPIVQNPTYRDEEVRRGSSIDTPVQSRVQNPPRRDEEVRRGSLSDTPVQSRGQNPTYRDEEVRRVSSSNSPVQSRVQNPPYRDEEVRRVSSSNTPVLPRVPSPPHREEEEEVKLSLIEELLVKERLGTQQYTSEESHVSSLPRPEPEVLRSGIDPTSYSAIDEESSMEKLQETRQTTGPKVDRTNPESPCPDVFSYERATAGKERWYGIVLLTTDAPLTGVRLVIRLNKRAHILGNWFGEVCSKDNIEYRIWNGKKKLVPGPPFPVKFFVKYGAQEVDPPRVRHIYLNGKQICSSSGKPSVARPSVSPSSTVRTTSIRPTTRTTVSTQRTTISTTQRITTRPSIPSTGGTGVVQCGTVEIQPSPFITHGQRSSRGQWPWHAALYRAKGTDLKYICGGTLIGKNSVLTAAHCVTKDYSGRPVDPETIFVYLGKYHLKIWSGGNTGVQDMQVDSIKVHPEYNSTNFNADIAILILATPAEFTIYVKPVCLWDRNKLELREVEGIEGTVVGWGFDERGVLTEELMMAKMPVVTRLNCVLSYPEFFPHFTSNKTFCAGFRNGTSVCNGDSGGGMVFPLRERPNSPMKWYLRGLVSLGPSQEEQRVCNTKHYVVFTDVAKYLDWIERTMAD